MLTTTVPSLAPTEELRCCNSSRNDEKDAAAGQLLLCSGDAGVADRSPLPQSVRGRRLCPGTIFHLPVFLVFPFWSIGHVRECCFICLWFWICQISSLNSPVFGEHTWCDFCSLEFTEAAGYSHILEGDVRWVLWDGVSYRRLPHRLVLQHGSRLLL